jgi:hypothetical protein
MGNCVECHMILANLCGLEGVEYHRVSRRLPFISYSVFSLIMLLGFPPGGIGRLLSEKFQPFA